MRLAIVASHPIQYQAPLFRAIAQQLDVEVFFAHRASALDQAAAGFGVPFDWDVNLLSGYRYAFLRNVSREPRTNHFTGCDTPEIGSRIASGRFDVLLVMGWYLKSMCQAIWAAQQHGIPVLVRGDSQLATPRSRATLLAKEVVYPFALRIFDAALYVGQRSKEYYEHYRYPASRLFFSPHCVDTTWFATRAAGNAGGRLRAKLGIGDNETVVLFAGKLVDFKRPLDAISALAALARRGVPTAFLVAGSGPLETQMKDRARQLDVSAHFLGFQNQSNMPAAYAAADVLVLPSSSETWGLVVNEALACGTPVVVSDAVGCAPDLAADGVAGRVFPVGRTDQLADAIADLIFNPLSADAIARRSELYSVDAACRGLLEALEATR
jgi:glycosyltransferase involved in cell wall biosynthesis